MEKYNKILTFEVFGDYGHFKKPYTTSSPLTFSFPPKPTVAGLIGAIIGLPKNKVHSELPDNEYEIGIKLINPVKKTRIATNLIHTKHSPMFARIKMRTQIKFEVLKNPHYKIYFRAFSENVFEKMMKIYNMLEEKKTHYTISLGLSQMLCSIKNPSIIESKKVNDWVENVSINSVILKSDDYQIEYTYDVNEPDEYYICRMPHVMDDERIVSRFSEFCIESYGKPINCKKAKNYWIIGEDNVSMF